MKKLAILLLAAPLLLASCGKNLVPFTEDMRDHYDWDEAEIQTIQFYTSGDIILQRQYTEGNTQIVSGVIKEVDGKEIEEILIEEGTPGVAVVLPKEERIGISFEISDNHFLMFGVNPQKSNRYYLLAQDWDGKLGKVTYNGEPFNTPIGSANVFLMVNLKKLKKYDIDQRKAKGRTVN